MNIAVIAIFAVAVVIILIVVLVWVVAPGSEPSDPKQTCVNNGWYWYELKNQCLQSAPSPSQLCTDLGNYWYSLKGACLTSKPSDQQMCQDSGKYWYDVTGDCLASAPGPEKVCTDKGNYWYALKSTCLSSEPPASQLCADLGKYWDMKSETCYNSPPVQKTPQQICTESGMYWDTQYSVCRSSAPTPTYTLPGGLAYGKSYTIFSPLTIDAEFREFLDVDNYFNPGAVQIYRDSIGSSTYKPSTFWKFTLAPSGTGLGLSNDKYPGKYLTVSGTSVDISATSISQTSGSQWVMESDGAGGYRFLNSKSGYYLANFSKNGNYIPYLSYDPISTSYMSTTWKIWM